MTSPQPIRVRVADDQKVVRDGPGVLLGLLDGIEVVGTAVDGARRRPPDPRRGPDIVPMDLNMPTVEGVEATRRPVEQGARARVVLLTTDADDDSVFRALQAGARGVLTKEVLVEIAEGHSNAEIAVKTHVNHLLANSGCRDRAALVGYAYRTGRITA